MSHSRLPQLPRDPKTNTMPSNLEQCNLSLEQENEILEATKRFSQEIGIDDDLARPCMATLFYEGVSGGSVGRGPTMHKLGLELKLLGLGSERIEEHLRSFNSRCVPHLSDNRIHIVLRGLSTDKYTKRYGCKKLSAWCMGEDACPSIKGGFSKHEGRLNGLNQLCNLGWQRYLTGSEFKVISVLISFRINRSYSPGSKIRLNFSRIENLSGVSRSSLRKILTKFARIGLINNLVFGNSWGSEKKLATELVIASPIPDPTNMSIKPLLTKLRAESYE